MACYVYSKGVPGILYTARVCWVHILLLIHLLPGIHFTDRLCKEYYSQPVCPIYFL